MIFGPIVSSVRSRNETSKTQKISQLHLVTFEKHVGGIGGELEMFELIFFFCYDKNIFDFFQAC